MISFVWLGSLSGGPWYGHFGNHCLKPNTESQVKVNSLTHLPTQRSTWELTRESLDHLDEDTEPGVPGVQVVQEGGDDFLCEEYEGN